ncbi:unnamed protein product [Sphenostylis stenocarpa]|uniref:Uncharacterized protein n=1 Tax=Sphenostylis stenocarpa TaxID=92480 RepID=A0AA86VI28_9FABA|nr:unnamed protein product [Sphenostylis stenocarpa]
MRLRSHWRPFSSTSLLVKEHPTVRCTGDKGSQVHGQRSQLSFTGHVVCEEHAKHTRMMRWSVETLTTVFPCNAMQS